MVADNALKTGGKREWGLGGKMFMVSYAIVPWLGSSLRTFSDICDLASAGKRGSLSVSGRTLF